MTLLKRELTALCQIDSPKRLSVIIKTRARARAGEAETRQSGRTGPKKKGKQEAGRPPHRRMLRSLRSELVMVGVWVLAIAQA